MDERDQALLDELARRRRVRPEELRRALGWPAKTFYAHLDYLVRRGDAARSVTRTERGGVRGVYLEATEDGETASARARATAWREIQDVTGRARWQGRGLTPREYFDCLEALARAGGFPRSPGRGQRRAESGVTWGE